MQQGPIVDINIDEVALQRLHGSSECLHYETKANKPTYPISTECRLILAAFGVYSAFDIVQHGTFTPCSVHVG